MTAHRTAAALALAFALAASAGAARASYAFYVGKDLTEGGGVLVGGTGEEVSSHYLVVAPRRTYPAGATVEVGVTAAAGLPGERTRIPQARRTWKYLSMDYTEFAGFPPPLTNGGLNEHQVAVRDVWSPSRPELVAMTPRPQRGPSYSDLARIALERATTAREAVEIVGALIGAHGYSTYGGNSHLFADPEEAWVMIEPAGGQGLWVAERLGPDEVRVLYPGTIGVVPRDYASDPGFMGSADLVSFAVEQGWFDPDAGEPFDFTAVYGRPEVRKRWSREEVEAELRAAAPLSLADFMAFVRDPRICDDESGYGQVADLRPRAHPELATLWVAATGSIAAPFVPFRLGVERVPAEWRQHRYLTKDAGRTFLHPDYLEQEATRFAGRVFKRLLYHVCADPGRFLPEVTEAWAGFEAGLIAEQATVAETAAALYAAERPDLAREYLTFYSGTRALDALRLGEDLLAGVEARAKVLGGIRRPEGGRINTSDHAETVDALPGADNDVPAGEGR